MKLHTSIGPNPRLVNMFIAEKGWSLPKVEVDIIGGENRRQPFLSINPAGGTPVLELDDGTALAETLAICEWIEETHPEPALIGATARARAVTRMWTRRVDLMVAQPLTAGFRGAEGLPLFKDRVRCLPQAADDLKLAAREGLAWLDRQLGERAYLAGDTLSLADLLLFCFVEFGAQVGQPLDPENRRLAAWHARMASRPGAAATA
ncbi:glutathione S-transferase family protein [Pseudoduganella namucuonensis]|uniref:Glutathione S-transferase n=1 Tax=Pseudoduganella namucuonensis TaxID=1035707 RepID=A0A1I7M038_9BURK|nr:glutathione S-transferase family protein [Pseudoduganella namucuonensis]SFV15217.1 Glutathione S-transferase [Pseudoduganella namucuonensis]